MNNFEAMQAAMWASALGYREITVRSSTGRTYAIGLDVIAVGTDNGLAPGDDGYVYGFNTDFRPKTIRGYKRGPRTTWMALKNVKFVGFGELKELEPIGAREQGKW